MDLLPHRHRLTSCGEPNLYRSLPIHPGAYCHRFIFLARLLRVDRIVLCIYGKMRGVNVSSACSLGFSQRIVVADGAMRLAVYYFTQFPRHVIVWRFDKVDLEVFVGVVPPPVFPLDRPGTLQVPVEVRVHLGGTRLSVCLCICLGVVCNGIRYLLELICSPLAFLFQHCDALVLVHEKSPLC